MVELGPAVLAVGSEEGCLDVSFSDVSFLFFFLILLETAWYKLKYCIKGRLTYDNQPKIATHS